MAKIIIDIKDNGSPNNGDILVYSKKDKCYIRTNRSIYFKDYEKKIKAVEDDNLKTRKKVSYMADVLNKYMKGNN